MTPQEKERTRMKADVFKALGNPVRLGIVELLEGGELCVCDIVDHVGTDMSNVSKHLSILKKQGIVVDRREGLKIFYSLTMPCVLEFSGCVEGVLFNRFDEQRAVMAGCGSPACRR
ncbi:ArsR/SmtB family transcription factor [Thermodesulfobacteriota bacterium]